jgi:hypothetical protein
MENLMTHVTSMTAVAAVITVLSIAPALSAEKWTSDNVTADRPFGEMDTSRAGSDFRGFWSGLSKDQRSEFRGRCAVIGGSDRYRSADKTLCKNAMSFDETTNEGQSNQGQGATGSVNQGGGAAGGGNAGATPGAGTDTGGGAGGAGAGGAGGAAGGGTGSGSGN